MTRSCDDAASDTPISCLTNVFPVMLSGRHGCFDLYLNLLPSLRFLVSALRGFIKQRPRVAASLAFGAVTAVVTHFVWVPDARWSGGILALTLAAGLAHAIAGAVTGPRLLDSIRTRTAAQACLLGAATSLLAVVVLAPPFALWITASSARPEGAVAYIVLTFFVGFFSFFAAGWALLLASVVVAWGLFWIAAERSANDDAPL